MAGKKDLTELVAEILIELQGVNSRLGKMDNRLESMDNRLARVEEQQIKTNAAIGELRTSVIRMADQMNLIHPIDERVKIPEEIVLKKGA